MLMPVVFVLMTLGAPPRSLFQRQPRDWPFCCRAVRLIRRVIGIAWPSSALPRQTLPGKGCLSRESRAALKALTTVNANTNMAGVSAGLGTERAAEEEVVVGDRVDETLRQGPYHD